MARSAFAHKKWLPIVQDFRSRGLSAPEFCRQENLNIHTLKYWLTKIPVSEILTLKIPRPQSASPASETTFSFPNGASWKVPVGVHPEWIVQILRALCEA